MEPPVFEAVAQILSGLVPQELGSLRQYVHRYGIKVWFDTDKAPKEHYEAQVVGAKDVPAAKVLAIEVGFHAEYSKEAENEAVLARLLEDEDRWRKEIGGDVTAGPFLGRAEHWRRVSETWPDPDLGDTELPFEVAARLTDYLTALEPVRRMVRS